MTIPSNDDVEQGMNESNDPFSKLSMEWNMENEKDLYETTSTVLQDETITTVFAATRKSSLEENERDSDCPLLQKVSIDHLPQRFQRLLNDGEINVGVEFFSSRIPAPPCCFLWIAAPFAMALVGVSSTLSTESTVNNGVVIGYVMAAIFAWILVCVGIAACDNHKKRSPLFAKDGDGVRKPWPGNWKIGTYLVGNSALLDFDGKHAWLFPVNSILRVDHFKLARRNAIHQTILVVLSPSDATEETFLYDLKHLDEPIKGRGIRTWHRRCTAATTACPE